MHIAYDTDRVKVRCLARDVLTCKKNVIRSVTSSPSNTWLGIHGIDATKFTTISTIDGVVTSFTFLCNMFVISIFLVLRVERRVSRSMLYHRFTLRPTQVDNVHTNFTTISSCVRGL